MVDHFAAFLDLELDGPIWALIVCVAVVSEADDVAFGVGEGYVAGVGRGFGQFVIAAGLDHLVGGEGGGEEVGDVDGMDGRCCLGLGGEGEEEKGEGYNCFCVGHVDSRGEPYVFAGFLPGVRKLFRTTGRIRFRFAQRRGYLLTKD